jgi:hypothetical protein
MKACWHWLVTRLMPLFRLSSIATRASGKTIRHRLRRRARLATHMEGISQSRRPAACR